MSLACGECKVGKSTIYAPTFCRSPDQVQAKRTRVVRVRPRQIIQRAHETPTAIYTIKSGWACRAVHFSDGRRQIVSFLLPGDAVNTEAMWQRRLEADVTTRALTEVTLCAFEPAAMHDMISASDEQRFALASFQRRTQAMSERRLVDIGKRRAVARVARLVLDLESVLRERRLCSGDVVDFPLRQEDVADALGLTAAHVNRTLVGLRRDGVFELRQGKAHFHDRAELERIGAHD